MTIQRKTQGANTRPEPSEEGFAKSRSRKKRESTALQKLGEELAALAPGIWKKLPLPPDLEEALAVWRGLKTREAKRRHMQYIGRLMREMDAPGSLADALDALKMRQRESSREFKRLEDLRDALLRENEQERLAALEKALNAYPALDRARLAHLMEAAFAERQKKRPPRQARELFRYLRDTLGTDRQ